MVLRFITVEIDQIKVLMMHLYYEFETLMDIKLFEIPPKSYGSRFFQRDFKEVEQEFLTIFYTLTENI